MRLFRSVLQLVLVVLVVFFGYHYFTRPELQQCVAAPLASLSGKSVTYQVDEAQVAQFLTDLSAQLGQVTQRGGDLLEALTAVETSGEASVQNQLLEKGQYLYCRGVVEQFEREQAASL